MIAKRVVQALKRQDWTMIAIEFVLVVVGVLLAFQINEWANERQAENERAAASERLLLEAEQSVAYIRLGATMQRSANADLMYALRQMQSGQWPKADKARMTKGLSTVTRSLPLAPPSAVYDDLIASGNLGKIGDAELRSAVAKYRATLNFHGVVVGDIRASRQALEDHPAFTYRFDEGGRQRVRLDVDYAALDRDKLLQEKLAMLAEGHRIQLLLTERALKGAKRMCIEVGRFVGRRCRLNLPPPTFD